MNELIQEGQVITKEQTACLAPYRKSNINRFGAYFLPFTEVETDNAPVSHAPHPRALDTE